MNIESPKDVATRVLKELLTDIKDRQTSFSGAVVQRMLDRIRYFADSCDYDALMSGLETAKLNDTHTFPYGIGMIKQALGLEICGRCNKFCRRTCPPE